MAQSVSIKENVVDHNQQSMENPCEGTSIRFTFEQQQTFLALLNQTTNAPSPTIHHLNTYSLGTCYNLPCNRVGIHHQAILTHTCVSSVCLTD